MTSPASPQPGNQDEREAEVVRRWMRPDSQVPEGRCPATGCWYTLPLVDGLVVQHSRSGTLNTCLGGGRPPYDPAAGGKAGAGGEADERDPDEWCSDCGHKHSKCECYPAESPDAELIRLTQEQTEPAPSAGQDTGQMRDALRIHHPIMRSETGPFSGCRCGGVQLGQDVIEHVVTELRRALDPGAPAVP